MSNCDIWREFITMRAPGLLRLCRLFLANMPHVFPMYFDIFLDFGEALRMGDTCFMYYAEQL
jgi:hypothetical protein